MSFKKDLRLLLKPYYLVNILLSLSYLVAKRLPIVGQYIFIKADCELDGAETGIFWTETLEYIEKNEHEITGPMILEIETKFNATQAHATVAKEKLQNETIEFLTMIFGELTSIFDHLEQSLGELGDGEMVLECINSDDRAKLVRLALNVTNKAKQCVDDKLNSAIEYIESIKATSDKALVKIANSKEEAAHCNEKKTVGSKNIFWSTLCSKLTAEGAITASIEEAAGKLATTWTKLESFMATYSESLEDCTRIELSELKQYSENLDRNTKYCVEGQLT